MGENKDNEIRPEPTVRRDGNIDFSRYATHQLEELRDSLDPAASPLNYAALLAELERRTAAELQVQRWTGRFSRRSGLAGWISAKLRRAPLYGEGTLEVHNDHLVLRGWQRTWLGFGFERALRVPLQRVRNAMVTASGVRLEIRRKWWFASRVEFLAADAAERDDIVRSLPNTQTARFRKYGASLLAFEEQLRARCPVAWVTPVLVLLNVAVFTALWIQAGSLAGSPETQLALLGANIGPLTLEGQWWRLLSATFFHADARHLLLNLWALWSIGRLSERLYGRWSFLSLYLCGGLFAGLSSLLWDPARSSIGASGAIFAVFGGFLAYLLRQRRVVPRGIFRSHWIPTLLFVGINLASGAMAPGVDNASHVGGLLCGFAMGMLLAGSHAPVGTFSPLRWATAAILFVLCAGSTLFAVFWTRGPTPVGQQFAARHVWYVSGEAKSNAAWQQLAGTAAAGAIADADLGRRIETEVLPFWKEAAPMLEAELPALQSEERRYVQAIARFSRLRLEWAEAVIAATSGQDRTRLEEARAKDEEAIAEMARIERLSARSNAARMTGGLVNLELVQKLRAQLVPQKEHCVQPPPAFETGVPVSDTDRVTDSPRVMQRIACQAQELFLAGDFKALDVMFSAAAVNIGDLPAGFSTLSALIGGLHDLIYYSENGRMEHYLRQLALWRRAVPDSYYPDLLEVELYQLWAWSARGHGTANQITPQAWAQFIHRNEMAQASLDDSSEAARQDPLWCHLAMRLQHDRTNDLTQIEETFRDCISRFPEFTNLYGSMLRALMPRWYGKVGQAAEFIERTSDALPDSKRDAMYARLFWMYADLEGDQINIFEDSNADWIRMHHGFHDLMEQYPKSDLILNVNARFACLADDRELYRGLQRKIMGRLSASAWTRETTWANCSERM